MKSKNKNQLFLWGLLLVFINISCEELPCEYSDSVNLNAGFYQSNGEAISDTTLTSVTLQLYNEIDTPYTLEYTETQSLSFPLSKTADTSTVILIFEDLVSDTLIFRYNRLLTLESHPCGFETFFEIIEINNTNNRLDSIWINKDLVEYGENENVKIYF